MPRLPYDLAARRPYHDAPFPDAEYEGRLDRTLAAMAHHGFDAIVVYCDPVSYASATWLTALTPVYGSVYVVVHADRRITAVMDGMLHAEPMHSMAASCRVGDLRVALGPLYGDPPEKAATLAADAARGAKRIGIVGASRLPATHRDILSTIGASIASADALFTELRLIKSASEIEAMRRAGAAADAAYEAIFARLDAGVDEMALAAAAVGAMRALGATESFETSVVGGPRSGLKHGLPKRGRQLVAGEMVFLDLGARVDGYCSDVSRCAVVGGVAKGGAADILALGLDLHHAGLEVLRPGRTVRDMADRLAAVAARSRWGVHYYPEGFGHGIGLDLFEAPGGLHATSDITFRPGMTIAYEPMVVVDGLGTAVIEDTLLVTETGYERLSTYPEKTWR